MRKIDMRDKERKERLKEGEKEREKESSSKSEREREREKRERERERDKGVEMTSPSSNASRLPTLIECVTFFENYLERGRPT